MKDNQRLINSRGSMTRMEKRTVKIPVLNREDREAVREQAEAQERPIEEVTEEKVAKFYMQNLRLPKEHQNETTDVEIEVPENMKDSQIHFSVLKSLGTKL